MKRTFIFTVFLAAITLTYTGCDQPMTSVVEPNLEADVVSEKVQAFLDAGGEIHVPNLSSLRKGEDVEALSCWVTEIGANLNMWDDDVRRIALPFPFTFYGTTYGQIYISSNGILTLNAPLRDYNPSLPYSNWYYGNNFVIIAPLFGDFNPSTDGPGGSNDVYYNVVGAAPNRQVVVTWNVVPEYYNDGTNTFQVVLTEGSTDILFGYNGLTTDGLNWNGPEMKVGVANGTASYVVYASGTEIPDLDGTNIKFAWNGQDYEVSNSCDGPSPTPPANQDPIADAGEDQTLECEGPDGTSVTLDGSASSDPDGDALTYSWTDAHGNEVGTDASFTTALGLGAYTFTLTVDDGNGGTASDDVTVIVEDTTPPVIRLIQETDTLWPVNGRMVLAVSGISAADVCCDVSLDVAVTGTAGDADDWEIMDNGDGTYNVSVRAERSGRERDGRVYTITVTATDCAGNQAVEAVAITVLHDMRKGK